MDGGKLLDSLTPGDLALISDKALLEKARRLPQHSLHRWWSRRFAYLYRGLLIANALKTSQRDMLEKAINNPRLLHSYTENKYFLDPFCGGGTGVIEGALLGYRVTGIDVNPVAVRISAMALQLLHHKYSPEQLKNYSMKVLRETFRKVGYLWTLENGIVSYFFITWDKVPSWVTTYSSHKTKVRVLRCPHCGFIFKKPMDEHKDETVSCPHCGSHFKITYKPEFSLKGSFAMETEKLKIWAVEIRKFSNGKMYRVIRNIDSDLKGYIEESAKEALEKSKEQRMLLDEINLESVLEGRRLLREGVSKMDEIFTPRQLVTFQEFAKASKNILPRDLKLLFSIALSESAKTSTILTRWHSPIGEPVPAASMKSYWVPEYTVETNPLAFVVRKKANFSPLARNTLASSLRNFLKFSQATEEYSYTGVPDIRLGTTQKVRIPDSVDIAIIDPPYLDSVRSYASLSLIHYGALMIYDYYARIPKKWSVLKRSISEVEGLEISREKEEYSRQLEKIFVKIRKKLSPDGRMVILFNRRSEQDWFRVIKSIYKANLRIISAYWMLGESPGKLGRSSLRGVYALVLKEEESTSDNTIKILFNEVIKLIDTSKIKISMEVEKEATKSLISSINSIFGDRYDLVRS